MYSNIVEFKDKEQVFVIETFLQYKITTVAMKTYLSGNHECTASQYIALVALSDQRYSFERRRKGGRKRNKPSHYIIVNSLPLVAPYGDTDIGQQRLR